MLLFIGESSSVGIVFFDTAKHGENAVFCRFEGENPIIESGEKSALLKKMKELDSSNQSEKHTFKIMGAELLFLVLFVAAVQIFIGGFFPVFGAVIFALIAAFPILVLIFACRNTYKSENFHEAFRSFHGAEHMVVAYALKKPSEFVFSEAKKFSPYHKECGTVYSASVLVFAAVLGIFFALIPKIGFLWFLGAFLLCPVLLFINLFNPYNPLMLFQRNVVKKPDEKTLFLAFEGIKKLVFKTDEE